MFIRGFDSWNDELKKKKKKKKRTRARATAFPPFMPTKVGIHGFATPHAGKTWVAGLYRGGEKKKKKKKAGLTRKRVTRQSWSANSWASRSASGPGNPSPARIGTAGPAGFPAPLMLGRWVCVCGQGGRVAAGAHSAGGVGTLGGAGTQLGRTGQRSPMRKPSMRRVASRVCSGRRSGGVPSSSGSSAASRRWKSRTSRP